MANEKIHRAAETIRNSEYTVVFTGAGISVESGIPPFRGPDGLWSKYNPRFIELSYFYTNARESWKLIKEIFFDFIGAANPNAAHYAIAKIEKHGYIKSVITQNIDNLHQEAGSTNVYEYHGTTKYMVCLNCGRRFPSDEISLECLPPKCSKCGGILKPDFVFFGETIPTEVNRKSFDEAKKCDVMLIVGTTGQVMPASMIPYGAKETGAEIIEVNISESTFTKEITDIFLNGKATRILESLARVVLDIS